MNRAAIYLEDTCCHYFVVRVHDIDLECVYLEKRKWTSGSGMSLEKFLDSNPNELEKYNWIDSNSEVDSFSEDTEKWTDREWSKVDSMDTKAAKAMVNFTISQLNHSPA